MENMTFRQDGTKMRDTENMTFRQDGTKIQKKSLGFFIMLVYLKIQTSNKKNLKIQI